MSRNERFRGQFQVRILVVLSVLLVVSSAQVHAAWFHKRSKSVLPSTYQPGSHPSIEKESSAAPDLKSQETPVAEVKVIGSRLPSFKESLNDIPSNVTYLDHEELKSRQPLRFQDAVRQIEGASFNDNTGNDWDADFGLRGFSGASNINFLVDGVRVNEADLNSMAFPLISMDDLEAIQIDRGSASPVYGTQAFAGVVNVTTGQPSEKPLSIFGGLEWGSRHSLHFYKGFSGTLKDQWTPIGGKFRYYFRGGRNVGKGWRNNDDWRITSFDIKMAYELPENQGRAYVNVKHVSDSISNPGEVTYQQYQDDSSRTNKPLDGRHYRNTIIQIGADKKFWDDHLTASIMNSWRPNASKFYSTTGTFVPWYAPTLNPYTSLTTTSSWDQNLISQLKYEDELHENVFNETQVGMEFRDQNQYTLSRDILNGDVRESAPRRTERSAKMYDTAFFWRETVKFWDKVAPYVGMRHDFNWLKTNNLLDAGTNISRRWNKSTISAGVNATPLSFADLFLNYSQGFRVPSISEVSPYIGTVPAPNLRPEKSDSYETGTRLRYRNLAAYKTSYFVIDMKDEIAYDSVATQNININRSRRYGIEQRVDVTPMDEVSFYGSYTWMRAYVRETTSSNSPVDGRSLGQIPENRFTLGTTVTPLSRWGENFKGLKFNVDGVFTGRQHPESFQSYAQADLNATGGAGHFIKGYSVWDFMTSYEWKEKMIYFKITNLFNEKYYSRARVQGSFGTAIYPAGTYTFVNPGAPREFVLGSRWEF